MGNSWGTKLGPLRQVRWLAVASAAAAIGLVACGDDDGDENPTTAGADATEATAAAGGEAVLIKTRVTIPTGEGPRRILHRRLALLWRR
jgi:hypothetical protein